jgi:methyl-accepting chemotaxis protein
MSTSVSSAALSETANLEIIHQVERTAQSAAAISLATQQQRSASEQVVTNMHNVAIMIGQNAEKVASVSVASLELQKIVRELLSDK